MEKIKKIIASLLLSWHFSLDTLLTHIFVIAFLYAGFPATAAFLMSLDALFRVMFSVFLSKLTVLIPSKIRGRLSAGLKVLIVIVWFIALSMLPIKDISIIIFIPFILFKILLMLDSLVSSEFIFGLKDYFKVDLSQSAAAQNILIRASTAVAPALALIILNVSYAGFVIFIISMIICIFSLVYLRTIFIYSPASKRSPQTKSFTFINLMANPYMRWAFVYQVVANLAFAGVSFILLKELKPHGDLFFNEITMLYSAFLFVQVAVLVFGEDIIPIDRTSKIAVNMAICAVAVITAGLSYPGLFKLAACFTIGLTYSITLSAVQKVVTTKLRGDGYIEFVGWGQMAGRLTSFASTMILGFALSSGLSSSVLLGSCGLLGLLSSSLLAFFQREKMKNFHFVEQN